MKIAVIGAGPSGIAVVKNLLDQGLTDITVFDRGNQVGGNWVFEADSGHSSVFETTHIISSKKYSAYHDYPMPAHYPDYPSQALLRVYFQSYADHFGVTPLVRFETTVQKCEPLDSGRWEITSCHASSHQVDTETFDYLVVCNGHHWKPRMPEYPGKFDGQWIHSHEFKRAAPFKGQRILVIGAGNSACDVAVETSRISQYTDISMRRGYWIVPKYLLGRPADHIHNAMYKLAKYLPTSFSQALFAKLVLLHTGQHAAYGMQTPDHPILATHPTANSELHYFIGHGEVTVKPDIARLAGTTVHFVDGTSKDYDTVICCTGYWITHPFFDKSVLDYSHGKPPLYLKMLPADVKNVAFPGLFQPLGCIWPAAELQAKILARMLVGKWSPPKDLTAAIAHELAHPDVRQIDSPRHTITVDYPRFRERLLSELPKDYVSNRVMPLITPKASKPGDKLAA